MSLIKFNSEYTGDYIFNVIISQVKSKDNAKKAGYLISRLVVAEDINKTLSLTGMLKGYFKKCLRDSLNEFSLPTLRSPS